MNFFIGPFDVSDHMLSDHVCLLNVSNILPSLADGLKNAHACVHQLHGLFHLIQLIGQLEMFGLSSHYQGLKFPYRTPRCTLEVIRLGRVTVRV